MNCAPKASQKVGILVRLNNLIPHNAKVIFSTPSNILSLSSGGSRSSDKGGGGGGGGGGGVSQTLR